MKRRALQLICLGVSLATASLALAHDCRVRDAYLRGSYEGDCDEKSEVAQGQGEAKGADSYVGTFVKGRPEGKGTYIWENGARLEGTFKSGKANGPGVYVSRQRGEIRRRIRKRKAGDVEERGLSGDAGSCHLFLTLRLRSPGGRRDHARGDEVRDLGVGVPAAAQQLARVFAEQRRRAVDSRGRSRKMDGAANDPGRACFRMNEIGDHAEGRSGRHKLRSQNLSDRRNRHADRKSL